ncbi:retrovirus-related pol polyprotein from transposon TNT 1-94 [Tanacetum coccineum]
MHNNSERKKQQVEDHHRNFKFSNNKTSVTACNDSLNAKTSNVNFVCVTYGKCVLNDKHDMCVLYYINGVNSRTKMLIAVPISTREPKRTVNQSGATPLKRTIDAESTNQKPRSKIRKQYEQISKTCRWRYYKITPPGYKWKPKSRTVNDEPNVSVQLGTKSRTTKILEPMTLRKSTHMTGNLKLLSNFVEQFLGTVKFGNDQIAPILGYGDLVQGNVTIKRVYYVEGLNHNLFSIGQFCDADLEVAFWKSTCYIHDLKGNDLLIGSCGIDLYSITIQDTTTPNPIFLMAKATSSQAWLWHLRLSHLNFDAINLLSKYDIVIDLPKLKFVKDHLCSSCKLGKAKYGQNLDKMKEKGDACIFVRYSTQSRAYMVYNKRTRVIVETIHVNFDELSQMASNHVSSDPIPQCLTTALEHASLSPVPQSQENVPHSSKIVTMSNKLDFLFSLMFNELLNGTTPVVSKSSVVTATDAPNQRQ